VWLTARQQALHTRHALHQLLFLTGSLIMQPQVGFDAPDLPCRAAAKPMYGGAPASIGPNSDSDGEEASSSVVIQPQPLTGGRLQSARMRPASATHAPPPPPAGRPFSPHHIHATPETHAAQPKPVPLQPIATTTPAKLHAQAHQHHADDDTSHANSPSARHSLKPASPVVASGSVDARWGQVLVEDIAEEDIDVDQGICGGDTIPVSWGQPIEARPATAAGAPVGLRPATAGIRAGTGASPQVCASGVHGGQGAAA
jgi:hypothetical protein